MARCRCEALPNGRLRMRFNDASEGEVDSSQLTLGPDAAVCGVLRDEALFRRARATLGAVTWPGDLDLAPDATYRGGPRMRLLDRGVTTRTVGRAHQSKHNGPDASPSTFVGNAFRPF